MEILYACNTFDHTSRKVVGFVECLEGLAGLLVHIRAGGRGVSEEFGAEVDVGGVERGKAW